MIRIHKCGVPIVVATATAAASTAPAVPIVASPGVMIAAIPANGVPAPGDNAPVPQSAHSIQYEIAQLQMQIQQLNKQSAEAKSKIATINAKWTYGFGMSAANQQALASLTSSQTNATNQVATLQANIEVERAKLAAMGDHVPSSTIAVLVVDPLEGVDAAWNQGFNQGLATGGKAVVNGAATAAVNTATLGLYGSPIEILAVTAEDRAGGYNTSLGIVTAAGEVLIGAGTAGLATGLAKGGKVARGVAWAATGFDAAGNVVQVGKGAVDVAQNGLNLGNGAQIIGGGLGLAGNVSAAKKLLNCFPAGTPVGTASGLRSIETIRPGDRVWAFNHREGQWQLRSVLQNFEIKNESDLVHVTIGGETIQSTQLHPYWVCEGNDLSDRPIRTHLAAPPKDTKTAGRWVDATDLRVGDRMLLRDGRDVFVERIWHEEGNTTVYNFAVNELENYAVGILQVLVHNDNGITGAGGAGDAANAPNSGSGMGNPRLGGLIKSVAQSGGSIANKVKALEEGAAKIAGITFKRVADIPGATAVFQGAKSSTTGKTPLLVVLKDGRILTGAAEDALIVDPSGVTNGLRILINKLREVQ